LFKDRNFVLSTIMYFALGFVLLPTIALTSPMLDELLNYPADTTGYMAIPRSIALVGALILDDACSGANRQPAARGWRDGLVVYANWRMLGYSPEMDWRPVLVAGVLQGAGLGILMPALTKTAFSTLDPQFRPEGTTLFNLSRLYGSTIGIALVLSSSTTTPRPCTWRSPRTSRPTAPPLMSRVRSPRREACHAQRYDHRPGGLRRGHRPVQGDDDRHADREPARAVSPQAAIPTGTGRTILGDRISWPGISARTSPWRASPITKSASAIVSGSAAPSSRSASHAIPATASASG
jgi:hypothetical protein